MIVYAFGISTNQEEPEMRRVLQDQTAQAATLGGQLGNGEVLRIGYAYGSNPDAGLYIYREDLTQDKLEQYMSPAGRNPVTFCAVPEDEM